MLERLPVRRHVRRLALLALALMALSALPNQPAAAQATITQPLDDTQADFAGGTFQRTAVNPGTVEGNPFADQDGMLQLATVGFLNPWQVSAPGLPDALGSHGVTTLGNRLYTVGGAVGAAAADAFTDAVYWATISPVNGNFVNHGLTTPPGDATLVGDVWINDKLPAAIGLPAAECSSGDQSITSRRGPAVAGYATGETTGYIYAIGGAFKATQCSASILTSPVVQIGAVAANGDITWSALPANLLPSQDDLPSADLETQPGTRKFGVEGATASIVSAGGNVYLYVIGGLSSYLETGVAGDLIKGLANKSVFYTKIDPATGALVNPLGQPGSPWVRGKNLPLADVGITSETAGIYNHTAMVSTAVVGVGSGTVVRNAIFVTGGYTELAAGGTANANPFVFRATIVNEGTGEIRWDTKLNPARLNDNITTEGQGRGQAAGFAYSNKLYVLGGVADSDPGTTPLSSVTTGAHDDSLSMLPLFGDNQNPIYFTGGDFTTPVINPVYGHGAAVLRATAQPGQATVDNSGWGYVVGGFGADDQPTTEIFRGKVGGPGETAETRRIPDGWYYSRHFDIRLDGENSAKTEAKVLSIRWFTGIDRAANTNADVTVQFRRTKLFPCNDAAFTGAGTEWKQLDVDGTTSALNSRNGFNEVKLRDVFPAEDFNSSCFQYRVYMTQNGNNSDGTAIPAANPNISPRLFSVNVEKTNPGNPDLQLETFEIGPDAEGRISTFNLQIKNLNGDIASTIAAPVQEFPVVLCVARTELGAAPPTLTVPAMPVTIAGDSDSDSRVDCAPIYRFVEGPQTQPGQVVAVNLGWQANRDGEVPGYTQDQALLDVRAAFSRTGQYAVAVLIDPFDLVFEGGQVKANNRGENLNNGQPLIRTFTITKEGFETKLYLPVTLR